MNWLRALALLVPMMLDKTPPTPPHKPDDLQFIQIQIKRDELTHIKRGCLFPHPIANTYFRVDFPNGEHAILPCSLVAQ